MKTFIAFLCVFGLTAAGQDKSKDKNGKDFNVVLTNVVDLIKDANKTNKPMRMAVITFLATKKDEMSKKNEFGDYLTESLISSLNANKKLFKMFERKRLDDVMRENDLQLTDLMSASQAQRVGELLPIDAIFSGSYTKLKNYIDINCRLIDVVTGEILVSFSGRIKMTADLESLFAEEKTVAATTNAYTKTEDPCKANVKTVKTLLNDLTTDDKIQNVVKESAKIPFDVDCGAVHFDVMYLFQRSKIDNSAYKKFLMATLDTTSFPGNDERAQAILEYLGNDGKVDDAEWNLGLKTLKKIGNYRLYICVKKLLNPSILPDNLDESKARIDEFCSAASSKQVGLPTPLSFADAFFQLMSGLKNDKDNRLAMYAYEQNVRRLEVDDKIFEKLHGILSPMYEKENNADNKKTIIKWLADLYNQSEKSDKTADKMYDFIRGFAPNEYNKEANKEIMRTHPEKDLLLLVDLCRDKFSDYAMQTKYTSQKEDRINFCLKYGVPIPGVIPTMPEAQTTLEGKDWEERVRVMKLLEKMGSTPKPLENTLVKMLDERSIDHAEDLKSMQAAALNVLGNIKTANPKAIGQIVEAVISNYYGDNSKNKEALVSIGKPAVQPLLAKMKTFTNQDGGLKYIFITLLGRIGKDAVAAKPYLQSLLTSETNKDVKYALEAALQAME